MCVDGMGINRTSLFLCLVWFHKIFGMPDDTTCFARVHPSNVTVTFETHYHRQTSRCTFWPLPMGWKSYREITLKDSKPLMKDIYLQESRNSKKGSIRFIVRNDRPWPRICQISISNQTGSKSHRSSSLVGSHHLLQDIPRGCDRSS